MTRYDEWAIGRNKFIQLALFGLFETLEFQGCGEYFIEDNGLVNCDYENVRITWSLQTLREYPSIALQNTP